MRRIVAGVLARLKPLWTTFRSPAVHLSLGFLTLGGFVAGVIFWGGFNTALEATNTEAFCVSCHEMRDNVLPELQQTIHFSNRSGVRAVCSDCHVPHDWTYKMGRKMQASKEVWGKIFGTIDTRHQYQSMDLTRQSRRAAFIHQNYLGTGKNTCIDCHKGIAHQLPNMKGIPQG